MATTSSEDEVRAQKIAMMGADLGELHFLLWRDVAHLHFQWQEYRELFATSADRVELMNKTAAGFFSDLERLFWQDVLLRISRLTDRPGSPKQRRVTLLALPSRVAEPRVRDLVNASLDDVKSKSAFARDWRNRLLAHSDHEHASQSTLNALKSASSAGVEDALSAIRHVMNLVERSYGGSEVQYEIGDPRPTGGWEVLYYLDCGLAAHDQLELQHNPWQPRFT